MLWISCTWLQVIWIIFMETRKLRLWYRCIHVHAVSTMYMHTLYTYIYIHTHSNVYTIRGSVAHFFISPWNFFFSHFCFSFYTGKLERYLCRRSLMDKISLVVRSKSLELRDGRCKSPGKIYKCMYVVVHMGKIKRDRKKKKDKKISE